MAWYRLLTFYSVYQLLDTNAVGVRREKMYQLDDHVACAVAGITGETIAPQLESRSAPRRIFWPLTDPICFDSFW